MSKPYKPISCDYVDYIEHLATLKEKVTVVYRDGKNGIVLEEEQLITWKNEGNGEYLYTTTAKIRLDKLVTINDKSPNDQNCLF